MTQIITALTEISQPYDALFCDLWGCVHNGIEPFPAAIAALQQFRAGGGKVVLLTNAPRPARDVIAGLERMRLPRDAWDIIVTSGEAAQQAMLSGAVGHRVWYIGPAKDEGFFTDIPPEYASAAPIARVAPADAEAIVCTGLFDELTEVPEDYRARLLLAKYRNLPMLCTNPDVVVDLGAQRLYCAGALAALYEEIGGKVLYFGKPHPPIYDLATRRLAALGGADKSRILAIGDGIATDIAGAAGEGLDALFITGGLAADQFGADPAAPDPALLNGWLAARQRAPRYACGFLR